MCGWAFNSRQASACVTTASTIRLDWRFKLRLRVPQAAQQREPWFFGTTTDRFHSLMRSKFAVPSPNGAPARQVEICSALAEWRAGAPAVGFQKIGRRGEHVRYAAPE